jgi:hypothetical protein
VVISGVAAQLSAIVNPNNIDTDCYFEYGPTALYGRRLATKSIHATLTDVIVSDTIAALGVDITYHCRLVATNAAGTTHSADIAFSVANAPPTIMVEAAVTVTGPKVVVFTATVNANNRSTESYFEYGQTTSYGKRTVSRSIGMGGTGTVVRDTIRGLAFDSTYHCRAVAENAVGQVVGADQSFLCSSADWQEFVFPLEAGTTWHYAYRYAYYCGVTHFEKRGHQVWRSIGPGSANAITILVTRIDTAVTYPRDFTEDTTTVITQVDTSFSIVVTADSVRVQWYQFAFRGANSWVPGVFTIPRFVHHSTDELTIQIGQSEATYVSGKGLTFCQSWNGLNCGWAERLTLESMSP